MMADDGSLDIYGVPEARNYVFANLAHVQIVPPCTIVEWNVATIK